MKYIQADQAHVKRVGRHHHFATATEDVTRAYAFHTARKLDVDCVLFSASGFGIISGYTPDPRQRVEEQRMRPEVVVINLGTNDDSFCQDDQEKQQEYMEAYERFLQDVRQCNPRAELFCVLGIMGQRLCPWMEKACENYSRHTGDQRIHTLRLPEQDGNIGYVADYHPLERFHLAAAEVLAPYIKQIMDW